MVLEHQASGLGQEAAALEVLRSIHPEVQVSGFALEELFFAEVVDFSSREDTAVVQMDLYKQGVGKIP